MPQYRGRKIEYRRKGLLRLRLRELLRARGMSAYGLARFTGLSLNTIYRLTRPNGRFQVIRADTIERLCAALRVTPSELFEYRKPEPETPEAGHENESAPGSSPGAPSRPAVPAV